jgi:hypothetical protein
MFDKPVGLALDLVAPCERKRVRNPAESLKQRYI